MPQIDDDERRPLRVLAAEDNEANRLVLRTIMDIFGVNLTVVENGQEAVEAWRDGAFDLVLMDIQMPAMDGIAATEAIRAAEAATGRAPTPIVALSANVMPHHVEAYRAAGMDLFVAKPIELPVLKVALYAVMALYAEREAAAATTTAARA